MFYDVKIFNAQGKIKRIVSAEELSRTHWNVFQTAEANKTLNSSTKNQVPSWVKKKLDMEYVSFPEITTIRRLRKLFMQVYLP